MLGKWFLVVSNEAPTRAELPHHRVERIVFHQADTKVIADGESIEEEGGDPEENFEEGSVDFTPDHQTAVRPNNQKISIKYIESFVETTFTTSWLYYRT